MAKYKKHVGGSKKKKDLAPNFLEVAQNNTLSEAADTSIPEFLEGIDETLALATELGHMSKSLLKKKVDFGIPRNIPVLGKNPFSSKRSYGDNAFALRAGSGRMEGVFDSCGILGAYKERYILSRQYLTDIVIADDLMGWMRKALRRYKAVDAAIQETAEGAKGAYEPNKQKREEQERFKKTFLETRRAHIDGLLSQLQSYSQQAIVKLEVPLDDVFQEDVLLDLFDQRFDSREEFLRVFLSQELEMTERDLSDLERQGVTLEELLKTTYAGLGVERTFKYCRARIEEEEQLPELRDVRAAFIKEIDDLDSEDDAYIAEICAENKAAYERGDFDKPQEIYNRLLPVLKTDIEHMHHMLHHHLKVGALCTAYLTQAYASQKKEVYKPLAKHPSEASYKAQENRRKAIAADLERVEGLVVRANRNATAVIQLLDKSMKSYQSKCLDKLPQFTFGLFDNMTDAHARMKGVAADGSAPS